MKQPLDTSMYSVCNFASATSSPVGGSCTVYSRGNWAPLSQYACMYMLSRDVSVAKNTQTLDRRGTHAHLTAETPGACKATPRKASHQLPAETSWSVVPHRQCACKCATKRECRTKAPFPTDSCIAVAAASWQQRTTATTTSECTSDHGWFCACQCASATTTASSVDQPIFSNKETVAGP